VQTRATRLEGTTRFHAGRLDIGGKPVAWDDVLFVIRNTTGHAPSAPNVVHLRTGERWRANAIALSANTLTVRLPLSGERKLPLSKLAAIDFVPRPALPPDTRHHTLYRDKGEPIPGKLLWLDAKQLAIDSPLGVLELPRATALRYVVARPVAPAPAIGVDEVLLTDGTLLRGRAMPGNNTLELKHATLGTLSLPSRLVAGVLRHPPGVHHLAEIQPEEIAEAVMISRPSSVARVGLLHNAGQHVTPACLKGWRLEPKASLDYRLPKATAGTRVLRCGLRPIDRAKGGVRLRMLAGDRALFDKELSPGDPWPALDLTLPGDSRLKIEVDFATRIRFPCGVVLCDPHVVTKPLRRTPSPPGPG